MEGQEEDSLSFQSDRPFVSTGKKLKTTNLLLLVGAALAVIGCGAVEDWYGRFDYGADGVMYLDLSKALRAGDWALGFSPYSSIGYPFLIAAARGFFPSGPLGEWTTLRVVNLLCFLAAYLSFLSFLAAGVAYMAKVNGAEETGSGRRFIYVIGTCLFLLMQVLIGAVSRVSPDLLVSTFFFLVNALSIRFYLRPSTTTAIGLGLVMGFGYVIKAIFLPISVAAFLALLLHLYVRRPAAGRFSDVVKLSWSFPALALIAIPYIAANSFFLGQLTLGETGGLNYAWNVNGMPHGTDWQGGPPPFGTPIHPTRLVGTNPPVFEFGEPFHVTYPPIFNQFYWYQGYHDFFSLHNQLHALKGNFADLLKCFVNGPHIAIKALVVAAVYFSWLLFLSASARREWWSRAVFIWPLYLPSLAGVLLYLAVVVEPRYIVGFVITLAVLPFLPLFAPAEIAGKKFGCALAIVFVLGAAVLLGLRKAEMFHRAAVNQVYLTDPQWKIGLYLAQAGLHPDDAIASVTVGHGGFCTWAHVCGLRIVAEVGNNTYDPDNQEEDFRLFATHPEVQQQVFRLFQRAGAVMVVVPQALVPPQGVGWEHVPGTVAWVHRLN